MEIVKDAPFQVSGFANALKEAVDAAHAQSNSEDGGTCNLDTCIFKPTRGTRHDDVKKAAKDAGIEVSKVAGSGIWKGYWFIWTPMIGQANRRTRMAEAAAEKLKAHGFNAQVWYQMD